MATENTNLSNYDSKTLPDATHLRFGIVVSEWNPTITEGLLKDAVGALLDCGVVESNIKTIHVPGSFELPLAAQFLLESKNVDAVICLGSVIQGETKHFDYVCQTTSNGIKDVSLKYNKAVIFGVLTDNTMQQAIDRSGGKHGNKGVEASITAIKMVSLMKNL